ncbi:MAG: hypothetical protein OWU84_01145 [Firmicutes bacterium]|nr:hypothetical protein [Bacillota bacterium]
MDDTRNQRRLILQQLVLIRQILGPSTPIDEVLQFMRRVTPDRPYASCDRRVDAG